MKPSFVVAALFLSSLAAAAPPVPGSEASSTKADQVVSQIHQLNQMEINVGRLAQRKGTTGDIKRYGLLLERDHRVGDKLAMNLAADQSLKVSQLPMSSDDKKLMTRLQALDGKAFDEAFLKAMDTGHQKAIGMLSSDENKTGDAQLDDLIDKLVPILQQHKELSQHLRSEA